MSHQHHAVLIDPKARTITDVKVAAGTNDFLMETKLLLGVDEITCYQFHVNDYVWVDDEGLFRTDWDHTYFWRFVGQPHRYVSGNALIIGTDHEGENVDAGITAEQLTPLIAWVPSQQVVIPTPTISVMDKHGNVVEKHYVYPGTPEWTYENQPKRT